MSAAPFTTEGTEDTKQGLAGHSDEALAADEALVAELRARGYAVTRLEAPADGYLTFGALAKASGRSASSLSRTIHAALQRSGAVPGLTLTRSRSGAIAHARPTAEFFTWLADQRAGRPPLSSAIAVAGKPPEPLSPVSEP